MGKSWGGKQAMIFTTTYPNLVNKLFLIAPASSDKTILTLLQKSNKDIFLGWAEDDYTVWYSNTKIWKEIFKSSTKLHLYSAIEGGHKILLEYLSPIIRVLQEEK
jgi:predicted esterase